MDFAIPHLALVWMSLPFAVLLFTSAFHVSAGVPIGMCADNSLVICLRDTRKFVATSKGLGLSPSKEFPPCGNRAFSHAPC